MYGAIIGDIVGSKFEFNNIKTKDFPFVSPGCDYTDDTVMTVAVAKALLESRKEGTPLQETVVKHMQDMGRRYPYPKGAYGGRFAGWLQAKHPKPYNSFGNGSAMRVSPCGLVAVTLEEAEILAKASAEVTHNHPEGIKGAQAVAGAIFLAKAGADKDAIRNYITEKYYPLEETLDEIRPHYYFDESCQGTVPQSIVAFLESDSYEDAIRNAMSIGGDSDTIGAITGAIAWSYYRFRDHGDSPEKPGRIWPRACQNLIDTWGIDGILPQEFLDVMEELDIMRMHRAGAYDRIGGCREIPVL